MEKLKKQFTRGPIIVTMVCVGIILIFAYMGYAELKGVDIATSVFDKTANSTETVSAEAYLLIGPMAESEYNNMKTEYYIAEGETEYFIVAIPESYEVQVPVYDETMTDEEIMNLNSVTIIGKTIKSGSDLKDCIIEAYEDSTGYADVTLANYSELFGNYYLDMTTTDESFAYACFIIAGILAIYLIFYYSGKFKKNKKMQEQMSKYEQDGELDSIKNDLENIDSKTINTKLKAILTDNYVISFKDEFIAIPLKKITNAYTCCMINSQISQFDFIALETTDNVTYYVASKIRNSKNKKFDDLLNNIKEKIKGE